MARRTKVRGLAAGTPLGQAARGVVVARLADVRAREARVMVPSPAKEDVHALRLAARRLDAAIRLLGDAGLRERRPEVDALKDALGPVRDAQVQTGEIGKLATRHLPRDLKTLQRALARWRRKSAPEIAVSAAALDRGGRLGGHKVKRRIARVLERMEDRVGEALEEFSPRAVHRARIAAKKLRYTLEPVCDVFRGAKETLAELEGLQQKLGDLHDLDALLVMRNLPAKVRVGLLGRRKRMAPAVERALKEWQSAKGPKRLRESL